MKHEVTAEYSEKLVKKATRRFLIKFFGWAYMATMLGLLAFVIFLLCDGSRGWIVGYLGALFAICATFTITIWIGFHHRALDALRKMGNPTATFVFDDDGIAVSSDLGSSTLKWQAVQKLWCFPEAWLLFFAKEVYSTIPTACLTDEVKQFIISKLKEQGTKISQP